MNISKKEIDEALAAVSPEQAVALNDYAAKYGKKWKARLVEAWLNDWREQWGVLRAVRNGPAAMVGMSVFLKNFKVSA